MVTQVVSRHLTCLPFDRPVYLNLFVHQLFSRHVRTSPYLSLLALQTKTPDGLQRLIMSPLD